MVTFIDDVTDKNVKAWYLEKNGRLQNFELVAGHFTEQRNGGYELLGNGLLIKSIYPKDVQEQLGYTLIHLVAPRPVDKHYHEDVGEAFKVLSGSGVMVTGTRCTEGVRWSPQKEMKPGYATFVPKGMPHGFKPTNDSPCLELCIACTGILKDKNEVQIQQFDKW